MFFRINLKEKALEDIRYEIRGLEETSHRHKERVSRGGWKICNLPQYISNIWLVDLNI